PGDIASAAKESVSEFPQRFQQGMAEAGQYGPIGRLAAPVVGAVKAAAGSPLGQMAQEGLTGLIGGPEVQVAKTAKPKPQTYKSFQEMADALKKAPEIGPTAPSATTSATMVAETPGKPSEASVGAQRAIQEPKTPGQKVVRADVLDIDNQVRELQNR